MQNTNESKEDKQKMEPSDENYKPSDENYKTSKSYEASEKYETSEKYGEENYKTPYDDEEKLLGLVEPNPKLAPPDYIDAPEAPPDYGKKSESHPPRISPWKRRVFFLIFASVWVSICLMGAYCGASLADKYHGNTKAVSDKIPCHKMSHKVEGVALGGEYMGHHGLGGHHGDSKGHHASMGAHHRKEI